jgi:hypothetical protein
MSEIRKGAVKSQNLERERERERERQTKSVPAHIGNSSLYRTRQNRCPAPSFYLKTKEGPSFETR